MLLLLLFCCWRRRRRHLHCHDAAIWHAARVKAAAQHFAEGGVHHADAVGNRRIVLFRRPCEASSRLRVRAITRTACSQGHSLLECRVRSDGATGDDLAVLQARHCRCVPRTVSTGKALRSVQMEATVPVCTCWVAPNWRLVLLPQLLMLLWQLRERDCATGQGRQHQRSCQPLQCVLCRAARLRHADTRVAGSCGAINARLWQQRPRLHSGKSMLHGLLSSAEQQKRLL